MLAVFFVVSCNKEKKEPADNGMFSVVPVDPNPEEPTPPEPEIPRQSWSMRINNEPISVDTTSITYSYENSIHVLRCALPDNNSFSISVSSLDSALYTIDLEHNIIEYIENGIKYDGANSPQGVIHIFRNQNNKLSANFNARLSNISTGQERVITTGRIRNVPYSE